MDTEDLPLLDVVLVTYNSAAVVPGLLASLPDALIGLDWRLIVADNNSSDDTIDVVHDCLPDAVVLTISENRGYAAGINAALPVRRPGAHVLVANPDVRLQPRAGAEMVQTLTRNGTGIVVPRLTHGSGRAICSLRRDPTVLRALGDAVLGTSRAGRFPRFGEMVTEKRAYTAETTADWASGAVMLLSHKCLERCGSWDESFFLYSEETEYCQRARKAGFSIRHCPAAGAVHLEGDSKESPQLWALLVSNRVRLYRRSDGRIASTAFWTPSTIASNLLW